MSIQGPWTAASPNTSARIASVESTRAGGAPGAVSRGARVLANVDLPLAGGPISRWQRNGAGEREDKGPDGVMAPVFRRGIVHARDWPAEAGRERPGASPGVSRTADDAPGGLRTEAG